MLETLTEGNGVQILDVSKGHIAFWFDGRTNIGTSNVTAR